MANKVARITAITASVLFFIAIVMLICQIVYFRTQKIAEAKNALAQITSNINGAAAEKIDSVCSQYASLQALTLQVKDKQIYAKGRAESLFAQNAAGERAIRPASSLLFKKISTAFSWQDGNVCVAEALFPVLERNDIFKAAVIPLFLILAGTVYVFIVLGTQSAKVNNTHPAQGVSQAAPVAAMAAMAAVNPAPQNLPWHPVPAQVPPAPPPPPIVDEDDSPKAELVSAESMQVKIEETRTGLLPEAYLTPALEDALHDALAQDADISLFVVSVAGLSTHPDEEEKVCKVIGGTFYDTHTIFELTPESFAVIVPQMSIEDALMIAESLFIPLSNAVKTLDPPPAMGIGISGRQGRNVSAMRLLRETLQANEKALENPEKPIVALKIDKEKYESYQKTHGNA